MLKYHELQPQTCEMGNNEAEYLMDIPMTLKQVLDELENILNNWGELTIFFRGQIYRCFDFNLYKEHIFYHHLDGWIYNKIVKQIKSYSCFMYTRIYITL